MASRTNQCFGHLPSATGSRSTRQQVRLIHSNDRQHLLPAWAAFALIDSNDGRYVHWLRSRFIPYASTCPARGSSPRRAALLCPQRPTRCSLKLEFTTRYPGAYHVFTVDAQLSCSLTSSTRHSASSRQGQAQQGGEAYRKAMILFESTNS